MFFSALIFSAFLEFGGMYGGVFNYPCPEPNVILPLYTSLSAEVEYNGLYVGGEIDCYFLAKTVTSFSPFQNTYVFRAGYRDGNVTFGYEHSCFHPFTTYAMISGNEIKPKYEGGFDKVYIRIETK